MKQYIATTFRVMLIALIGLLFGALLASSCHTPKQAAAPISDTIAFPAHYRALVKALGVETIKNEK